MPDAQKKNVPPFRLDLDLAPSAFLSMAHELEGALKVEANHCTVTDSNLLFKFDATTGRPEEFRSSDNKASFSARFITNGFDSALLRLESSTASFTNQFVDGRPLSSIGGFVLRELASTGLRSQIATNTPLRERMQAAEALQKLLDPGFLAPLDQAILETQADAKDPFVIPLDELDELLGRNSLFAMFSGFAFNYVNRWFPKYSWPWTLARESALMLASQGAYADTELNRLRASERTGPVGCLVLASVLTQMGTPVARTFALTGITRLSAASFQHDCRLFLEGDLAVAQSFVNLAESLRRLPPAEVEALARVLPSAEAALLKECAEALRAHPEKPLAGVVEPALTRYWDGALRAQVRSALLKLTAPPQRGKTGTL